VLDTHSPLVCLSIAPLYGLRYSPVLVNFRHLTFRTNPNRPSRTLRSTDRNSVLGFVTHSIVRAPLQSELLPVFKSTSQDQKTPFWSSSIAILSPSFPWLLVSTSPLLPFIRFISRLISPLLFIYLLSILVEVLLCLLTYRDLVLLYLVSEDHS
jgi:hypothetical protein